MDSSKTGVEDAAQLQLGPEFQGIDILSNAQVAVVLQVSAQSAVNRDEELHEVYRKTQAYVDRVNNMTNPEKNHQELVKELDNLMEYVAHDYYLFRFFRFGIIASNILFFCFSALTSYRRETDEGEQMGLAGSEVAALMNLVATDTAVDEAKTLIPSLGRFPEAAIDEILDLIRTTMIRIVS